ncbi:uncharacterized protein LOC115367773 [Myripristis murdjan]|uniref:uncharacterized protein LOC115367773 n=1 Tax=Myripristis murdjan TaxID=586833 RepID=UPI001175FDF9|nr:uncharacterized protein LOC115367773 [Myripristis murdjan]
MAGKGGSGAKGQAVGGDGCTLTEKITKIDLNSGSLLESMSSGSTSQNQGANQQKPKQQKQQTEDISDSNSSEVANDLNAGGAGSYKHLKNRRLSERDDCYKCCMEADHIPPLDSWKRARQHPEFDSLKYINPALHKMACSLENDKTGQNLLAIEVPTQSHRVNLTTGNSKISQSVRTLLADYIVLGQAERMLKLAFIVAHPVASNQIRKDAGFPEKECEGIVEFREERILKIYRKGFLELLELYHEKKVINQEELERLTEFVENKRFLQRESDEYKEILGDVKKNIPDQPNKQK